MMAPAPAHPLLRRAIAQTEVLRWHSWAALAPGPSLLVLGAVHGNEVCGAHADGADDHGRRRERFVEPVPEM